jgi:hypothetical protein
MPQHGSCSIFRLGPRFQPEVPASEHLQLTSGAPFKMDLVSQSVGELGNEAECAENPDPEKSSLAIRCKAGYGKDTVAAALETVEDSLGPGRLPGSRGIARWVQSHNICASVSFFSSCFSFWRRRLRRTRRSNLSRNSGLGLWNGLMYRYGGRATVMLPIHFILTLPQVVRMVGDVFHAYAFVAAALGHDAVIERYAGDSAAQLANLKTAGCFTGDVESVAVAIRR